MHGGIVEVIEALSSGLDELLSGKLPSVTDAELIPAQRALQTLTRKAYAAQLELDAATERAGITRQHGYATVGGLLMDVLRIPRAEARARDTHRDALATRRSLAGEVLAARLPATARARTPHLHPTRHHRPRTGTPV